MKNKHRIKQGLSLLLAGALTFTNVCQRQQVVVVIYGLVPLDRLPPRATNKKAPAKL